MAEKYEVANMLVALGGDIINTVPRYGVTAAEAAVLQAIHGNDALTDIVVTGTVQRSLRAEKARIRAFFVSYDQHPNAALIDKIYPGAAARLFERYDELELAEIQFRPGHVPAGFVNRAEEDAREEADGLRAANGEEQEVEEDDGEDLFADEPNAPAATDPVEVPGAEGVAEPAPVVAPKPRGRKAAPAVDALA